MFFWEPHHGANLEGGQQDTMNNSLKHKHPGDFSPVETTQFDPKKPWRVTFYNQRNFGHVFFYIVHHPQNKGHVFFRRITWVTCFFSCPQCYFWLPWSDTKHKNFPCCFAGFPWGPRYVRWSSPIGTCFCSNQYWWWSNPSRDEVKSHKKKHTHPSPRKNRYTPKI